VNIDDYSSPPMVGNALLSCLRRLLSWAMFLAVPLVLLYVFGFSIKTSEEYACVLQIAESTPEIIEITGEPVSPGTFAWISYFESGGGERQGAFATALTGPQGKGTLKAQFYRTPIGAQLGVWFKTSAGEIEIYNSTYPCP